MTAPSSARVRFAVALVATLMSAALGTPVPARGAEVAPAPAGELRVATIWKGKVHVFREATMEHLGTIAIPRGWAQSWWLDAAGERLVVVSREGLLKQKGPEQVTVVDLAERRVVATHALGWGGHLLIRQKTGRVGYVTHLGVADKKKRQPAQIARIDALSGALTARVELAEAPTTLVLSSDEAELAVVFAGQAGASAAQRRPGRLEVLDAATLAPRGSVTLPGPATGVFWDPDRTRLYALDAGIDDKRPGVALPGRVYVLDPKGPALLADLELGVGPGPLSWDDERDVFYVLTRPHEAKDAEASLQIVRGAEIVHEIGLPKTPTGVFPNADRSRFYVLEDKGITVVDGALETIEARWALPDTPTGLLLNEAAGRAYASFGGSSKVAALDLATGRVLAEVTTGRTGKKVGLFAAAVLGTALSASPYAMAQVVTYPSPATSGQLSPDGSLAFFFNTQTGDYTVVDVASGRIVDHLAGGGLSFLRDGKTAFVAQATDVLLWDTASRRQVAEIDAGGGGKTLCPDGDHVWAMAGISSLNVVELARRSVVKRFDELGGAILFYRLPEAEPAVPEELPAVSETPVAGDPPVNAGEPETVPAEGMPAEAMPSAVPAEAVPGEAVPAEAAPPAAGPAASEEAPAAPPAERLAEPPPDGNG